MVTKEVNTAAASGIMEGGAAHCSKHNFRTDNVQKWKDHLANEAHVDQGQKPCIICNKVVTYDEHPTGRNAVCDECKPLLLKGDKKK